MYAAGTYVDPIAMSAVKQRGDAEITKALLDPNYPRTIRIVLARNLSAKKFTDAIVEALEPRMKGLDLDKLSKFISCFFLLIRFFFKCKPTTFCNKKILFIYVW